ncbi:MAG: hypothetical protein ACRDSR_22840 [Pseudonocardiaceae bacterium]
MTRKLLATIGVLGAALVLMAVPAAAEPGTQPASVAASVPNCVKTKLSDDGYTDHLKVTNGCDSGQRIKVVVAHGPDFACEFYNPGGSRDYQWGYPGRFDGLQSC